MTRLTDVTDALSATLRRDAHQAEAFADLLEGGRTRPGTDLTPLLDLARSLAPAEHRPEPGFRTALRARLVAEAATRVPAATPRPVRPLPGAARPSAPRWRSAVAALAVISAVTGVGAAAASSQAVPGDALYGLKLRVEAIQLSLADSDLGRGRQLLEQAEARLGEAEQLAADGTTDPSGASVREELAATLRSMDVAATAGAAALVASYDATGDPEPMLLLAQFVARQQQRLQALSVGLDPDLQGRLLRTLDTLSVLGTSVDAVLSPIAPATGEAAGPPGRARVDGQAVNGRADRGALPPSAAIAKATGTKPAATGTKPAATGTKPAATGTISEGLVGLEATSSGPGVTGTDASVPSVPSEQSATSVPAASATAASLPGPTAATVPEPSVAAPPLPTVTAPVTEPTTLPPASTSVSPAPVTTCVAVAPLTTC